MNAMNKVLAIMLLLATALSASIALAKTTSKTISVSATLTNGSSTTVNVSIIGNSVHEAIGHDRQGSSPTRQTLMPVVRIGFDMDRPVYFVKRVTWDKPHRQLTIDF
jgi:hypothetical protein